jgi:hypothetical protein
MQSGMEVSMSNSTGWSGAADAAAGADEATTACARRRELQRLLPLWPHEIADGSLAAQRRLCRLLLAAVRRERQRGIAGEWTYDVVRHAALARALRPELARLAQMAGDTLIRATRPQLSIAAIGPRV